MLALSSYLGLSQLTRIGVQAPGERAAHAAYVVKALSVKKRGTQS
jgi:hypothetical protein